MDCNLSSLKAGKNVTWYMSGQILNKLGEIYSWILAPSETAVRYAVRR